MGASKRLFEETRYEEEKTNIIRKQLKRLLNSMKPTMELHYKCTTWCKLKFPATTNVEELIKKLNEGYLPLELAYDNEIEGTSSEKGYSLVEWEAINDTEEYMSPEENDGLSTIELYSSLENPPIWDNSFESELKRKNNG